VSDLREFEKSMSGRKEDFIKRRVSGSPTKALKVLPLFRHVKTDLKPRLRGFDQKGTLSNEKAKPRSTQYEKREERGNLIGRVLTENNRRRVEEASNNRRSGNVPRARGHKEIDNLNPTGNDNSKYKLRWTGMQKRGGQGKQSRGQTGGELRGVNRK